MGRVSGAASVTSVKGRGGHGGALVGGMDGGGGRNDGELLSMTKKITVLGPDGTTAMFKIKEVPSMSTWTLTRKGGGRRESRCLLRARDYVWGVGEG